MGSYWEMAVAVGIVVMLVPLGVWQRQARRLCRAQESGLVAASFDAVVSPAGGTEADVVIVSRPSAWQRYWLGVRIPPSERWLCQSRLSGYFQVTAHYRRRWWGWAVQWQVVMLDEQALRLSLADEPQVLNRVFGHLAENRLYA